MIEVSPDQAAPTLSVIVPTTGRDTLARTLESVTLAGYRPGHDEMIVVRDGPDEDGAVVGAVRQWSDTICGVAYVHEQLTPAGDYGGAARSLALATATRDWATFMDDDDVYTPGALAMIRAALVDAPRVPHVFRMIDPGGNVLWRAPRLEGGNLGTPCIVVPVDSRLPRWGREYDADFRFLLACVDAWHGSIVWREEVVCQCRPK